MDFSDYPHKTEMTADLFRVGDIVAPSCGSLTGVKGVVADVRRYVTIMFPKEVRKYPNEPTKSARREWRFEPSNVRLLAFPRRPLKVRKSR